MQRSMWSATTGMQAQQLQIDTIANNLANVGTNGFKRSRAEFQDILYQTVTAPGAPSSSSTRNPAGIQMGLGTKPSSVKKLFSQGDFKKTDNPMDLVIQGQGFFKVLLPDGTIAYTRDGAFTPNQDGQLVTAQGFQLDPAITLPSDTLTVTVGVDGTVSVTQPGQSTATEIGQIEIANFLNPTGLQSIGSNLLKQTQASGDPVDGTPGLEGLGTLAQGFLEMSNVSIVSEMVDMIAAQRAYELNSKVIRASDEMLQQVTNLVR
jgi:flagellar basal-body rod protein FlgG